MAERQGLSLGRAALIRLIHVGARALRMDEDARRDLMERITGKRSAAEMTEEQLHQVADALRHLGFEPKGGRAQARAPEDPVDRVKRNLKVADGEEPQLAFLMALWEALCATGRVRQPNIGTLQAVMERSGVHVAHPRFCTPSQRNKVIEALKDWLRRAERSRPGAAG